MLSFEWFESVHHLYMCCVPLWRIHKRTLKIQQVRTRDGYFCGFLVGASAILRDEFVYNIYEFTCFHFVQCLVCMNCEYQALMLGRNTPGTRIQIFMHALTGTHLNTARNTTQTHADWLLALRLNRPRHWTLTDCTLTRYRNTCTRNRQTDRDRHSERQTETETERQTESG